jgi:hypothetical protein
MMNADIRNTLDQKGRKRVEDEKAILYEYYKRVKHMTNKDARDAVSRHFTYNRSEQEKANNIFELTKHWNDLNNER